MKNLDRLKARATTVELALASAYLDICYRILEVDFYLICSQLVICCRHGDQDVLLVASIQRTPSEPIWLQGLSVQLGNRPVTY